MRLVEVRQGGRFSSDRPKFFCYGGPIPGALSSLQTPENYIFLRGAQGDLTRLFRSQRGFAYILNHLGGTYQLLIGDAVGNPLKGK